MPAACPSPEGFEDRSIYRAKGVFAAHMPMIVRPAPDHRVKLDDQIAGFGLCVTLDDLSDFSQERFYIAGRRCDDDFAVAVLAYVLSEKIKARFNGGDSGFLR
jgi:hypothetical protein